MSDDALALVDVPPVVEATVAVNVGRDGKVYPAKFPARTTAEFRARLARIVELAAEGATSRQIGNEVGITDKRVRILARREGITIVGDVTNRNRDRRLDSTRVVSAVISQLDGIDMLLDVIDYGTLPMEEIPGWITSLGDAVDALNHLRRRLKEATQP